jgi:hypothetical protein
MVTKQSRVHYHDNSSFRWTYAIRQPGESPIDAVERSIERRFRGKRILNGLRLVYESPKSRKYATTLVAARRWAWKRSDPDPIHFDVVIMNDEELGR